jgi:hypothetical protein
MNAEGNGKLLAILKEEDQLIVLKCYTYLSSKISDCNYSEKN